MVDQNIRGPDDADSDETEPITRIRPPTPKQILNAWRENSRLMQASRMRMKEVRDIRRRTLVCERPLGPEGKPLPGLEGAPPPFTDPSRDTIEIDLANAFAAAPPIYDREPIGTSDSAAEDAEQASAWLREMGYRIQFGAYVRKLTEDAEFMRLRLPSPADALHIPDYFDTLLEGEYKRLPKDKRGQYEPFKPKPGKRVRMEEYDGPGGEKRKRQAKNPAYDRDARGRPPHHRYYKTADKDGKRPTFERDEVRSKQAHDEAVLHYIAEHPPIAGRIVSAFDCAPGFKRGTDGERFALDNAVVRTLMTPRQLQKAGYGWAGLDTGKALAPRSYDANRLRMDGVGSDLYLYEYFWTEYDEDGICHPCAAYTVGGAATWDDASGDPEDKDSVKLIDFYEEYGIDAPLWSYHWGMGNEDDEPAERSRPILWTIKDALLNFEDMVTTHLSAARMNAFTGYVQIPDTKITPVALMDGTTNTIRKPQGPPRVGETITAYGEHRPWNQAKVGEDADKMEALMMGTVRDHTPDPAQAGGPSNASGHSKIISNSLLAKAKQQIRASALEACRLDQEDNLRIACAFARKFGIDLAVYPRDESVASDTSGKRTPMEPIVLDERWIGNSYRVVAKYPEEGNLAEVSLEADLTDRGYSHPENVLAKKGVADTNTEMLKIFKYRQMGYGPPLPDTLVEKVAKFRNDVETLKRLKAQSEQQITAAGIPGMEQGMPTAAMAGVPMPPGPQNVQPQGPVMGTQIPDMAANVRGGIVAGEMAQAANQADAAAQLMVGAGAV